MQPNLGVAAGAVLTCNLPAIAKCTGIADYVPAAIGSGMDSVLLTDE
jgi:hypothetical protein